MDSQEEEDTKSGVKNTWSHQNPPDLTHSQDLLSVQNSMDPPPSNEVKKKLIKIKLPGLRCDTKRVHMEIPNDMGVVAKTPSSSLLNNEDHATEDFFENKGRTCEKGKKKRLKRVSSSFSVENDEDNNNAMVTDTYLVNNSERLNSQGLDGVGFSEFTNFESFKIVVNGMNIDSDLPENIRTKYFDLCATRRSILHGCLLKSITTNLATEIICVTTHISESIRDSKLSTCGDDLKIWSQTLEGFKTLGMDVGFMLARINRLEGLVLESTKEVDSKRYKEAKVECCKVEEEIKDLESKLSELKMVKKRLFDEIEEIKRIAQEYKGMFQDKANAPW